MVCALWAHHVVSAPWGVMWWVHPGGVIWWVHPGGVMWWVHPGASGVKLFLFPHLVPTLRATPYKQVCDVTASAQTLNVNSDDEERQPLLGNKPSAGEKKQDGGGDGSEPKKSAREHSVTIGRLLRFSRPDWFLLLGAFVFLCASASGEHFRCDTHFRLQENMEFL